MENSALRTFYITVAIVLVLALGAYWYLNRASTPAPASNMQATSTDGVSGLPAGSIVTDVPITTAPVAPNFRTKVAYSASVTAEVQAAVESRFTQDVALLAKNNQDFNAWMDLAILHKIGGDYHGAETIWLYITKNWSTSFVAYHNLGDLYENFLHDTTKAKLYYAQAAKLSQ